MYNLTNNQKEIAKWLVYNVQIGKLKEEFLIYWVDNLNSDSPESIIPDYSGEQKEIPTITQGVIKSLMNNQLILCYSNGKLGSWRCTLTGKAYEAVETDFNAPDTSFIKYLTPLADITDFDQELKQRCLPILGAGATDPMLWDSAVRTAGVILEERLRDVGSIPDPTRTGQTLVNDVFGNNGTLVSNFSVPSEREGYRNLYAGIVGAFRNPSVHRLIDPSPEEGGAFIAFVNLLLKKLEVLR